MNINADLPRVNKILGSFDTVSEESPKFIGTDEETNWMGKALEDVKNAEKGIKLLERISYHVGTLSSFTPDKIVRLVSLLDQRIKRELHSQEATNYLCLEVAALIIKKDYLSFENFLKQSDEKNVAIQVIIQLVKERKLGPLAAVKAFQRYGIDQRTPEGQRALIEIAKLAAQRDGWGTSLQIKEYGIDVSTAESRQALIQIAKLAAQENARVTSQYIKNYGIDAFTPEGQQGLIEIAKLAAQRHEGISQYINNFDIEASTSEGQQALMEIAKLAAQKNGGFTSEYIENYGIDRSTPNGRQALIEIAKLAAQQDGSGTSKYIKNYGLDTSIPEGQQALIEIAKLAVQQNGYGTSSYIKNYGIQASTPEGQQALIEIAKLAPQQNGTGTSKFIKDYGIDASTPEGQKALIEIAKLAAQQDGTGTSEYIENYGIDRSTPNGRQALIEIAKLAAQQDGEYTSQYINNYGIDASSPEGQQALIEIVKLAAQQNGTGTSKYINNYDIRDAIQLGIPLLDIDSADLQWVQKSLSKTDNEVIQTKFLEWWMGLACQCASREDLKKLFREKPSVFERMSTLPPDLRTSLTLEVIASSLETKGLFLEALKAELVKEAFLVKKISVLPRDLRVAVTEIFIRGYQGQHAETWENLKKENGDIAHARLANLILSQYPIGDYTSVLGKIKSDRNLRDVKHQQPLLETLLAIKNCTLEDAAKIDLLNKVFAMPDKDQQTVFRLVADIINFKGEAYLREFTDFQGLKSAVEKLFSEKCQVQLDNFTALYENTVGTWRSKEALLTYAGKHTDNPAVLPFFQEFLTAVLKGNFQTTRYTTDNNPHLAEIEQHYLQIFENWKLSVALKDAELGIKDTGKAIPVEKRVVETLKQAVENQHLGLERQEALFPILDACRGKWELLDQPLKLIAQQLAPLLNRRLSTEEIELKKCLLLQKAFLELIKNPGELEKKLNILKGIKIKGLDEDLKPFYRDLEDGVKFMHSSGQPKAEGYKVIDTDDPNHFLLMGTEVLNSCQNVNGSASLNVGLLGYAMDGKHRLALVCDPEGKILARSVLRLLLDAEGKPVIFQERMYVADANPAYPQLLRKMALKKASLLAIPLVVSPADFEIEQAKKYPLSIQAKAKPVPFEYVDALGGLRNGPYTISNALHIYTM